MKHIVKNCPALSYGRTKFKKCYRVSWKQDCKDYENCPIKQIVGLCKEKIKVCEGCSKTADINIDCVECDEKGEANISRAIVNLLEIEEVNEQL